MATIATTTPSVLINMKDIIVSAMMAGLVMDLNVSLKLTQQLITLRQLQVTLHHQQLPQQIRMATMMATIIQMIISNQL